MVRKTRKHYSAKGKQSKGVYSIPELRRSFEHIEEYVDSKIASKESKDKIVKDLRKEWSRTFFKDLDKKSAEAFVSGRMSKKHSSRHRTIRRHGGAGAQLANTYTPIAGAPTDYTTRAGLYLAPGQIPDKAGHLPLSDGSKSTFGSFIEYVSKGFRVGIPEPGQPMDQFGIPGQIRFPTSVAAGMGSNTVHFGMKGGKRRTRRGGSMGSFLSEAFQRPIPASSPPGILQDMQDMWYGREVGPSPDQVQRGIQYQIGSVYPKAVTF